MILRSQPEAAACGRTFAEELLTGYIDGALTQAERQRVRIHLEDCAECRTVVDDLCTLRETAMTTDFVIPPDDQWDETPRTPTSRLLLSSGWTVLIVWAAAIILFCAWQLATAPEALVEKLLVFGGVAGAAMLFFSVLADRLKALPRDRYRRVEK